MAIGGKGGENDTGDRYKNKRLGRPPETSFPLFLFFFRDSQAPCQAARRLPNLPVKRLTPVSSPLLAAPRLSSTNSLQPRSFDYRRIRAFTGDNAFPPALLPLPNLDIRSRAAFYRDSIDSPTRSRNSFRLRSLLYRLSFIPYPRRSDKNKASVGAN